LREIGEDPQRDGLKDTPLRVARMYREIFSGYSEQPRDLLKTFEEKQCDQIVHVGPIKFASFCEHHMMPFVGSAHIAYIPDGRVLGLSKFARIVQMFSARLQLQERLTEEIAEAIDGDPLFPKATLVMMEAEHTCMSLRGPKSQDTRTTTSAIRGLFEDDPSAKSEALSLIFRGG
jgi:GTP cyclohydrolase IA